MPLSQGSRTSLLGFGPVAILIMTCANASAQESGDRADTLEELIVTARRIEESQQDVPIAITTVTGKALLERGIFSTDTLDNIVPNLQFSNNAPLAGNNNSSQVFIRGIGQTDPTGTVDPGVGLYIDDVYMGQSIGGTMDFRDIASVQVLRGPQGTLFGRNTIGGAILLNTTEPGDTVSVTAQGRVGTDNLIQVFGAIDLPVSDKIRTRFTVGSRDQDGYVTRLVDGLDLGDTNNSTFTGKVIFDVTDNLQVKLLLDHTQADENGTPLVFAASTETAAFQWAVSIAAGCPGAVPGQVPLIDDPRCANDFQAAGPFANNGTFPLRSRLENYGGSFQVAYALSDTVTVKSITAFRQINWEGTRDADNTPFPILHTEYDSRGEQFSQEVQVSYVSDRLSAVTGLFLYDEVIDDMLTVTLAPPPAPLGTRDSDNVLIDNHNYAVFGQVNYDLTDSLSLTVGARYTDETKASTPDQFSLDTPDIKWVPNEEFKRSFDALTLNVSAAYRWSDALMTYATFSQGFKSGGWNSHFNFPIPPTDLEQIIPFAEEKADNLEFGFKADLLNNSLRINGAVFFTDYRDLQITFRYGVAPFLTNAGSASNNGAELEVSWIPAPGLIIDASLAYLDANIDEVTALDAASLQNPIVTGVAVGNRLPFAPEFQGSFGIGYDFEMDGGYSITPRIDTSFQTTTFFDAINTPEIAQNEARFLVDASIALNAPDQGWQIVVGGLNLTNQLYPIAGNSSLGSGSGYAEIGFARRAQWYVDFRVDF